MLTVISCIAHEHDLRLVSMAALISAVASFTTINLLARMRTVTRQRGWVFLLAAAVVFGGGVWSLHFVAMIAYKPDLPIAYDVSMTVASVLIAALGALIAFGAWLLVRPRRLAVLAGGALLGLSVASMHYVGIAAMRLPGSLEVDRLGFALSILISVSFATLALARSEKLDGAARRVEVSVWLAAAVCGLHFTGMVSLTVTLGLGQAQPLDGSVLASGLLAVIVGSVSFGILVLGLVATIVERHLWQRSMETDRMRRLASVVREGILIHRDGRILEVNEALCRLLGEHRDGMIGRHMSEIVATGSVSVVASRLTRPVGDLPPAEIELRSKGEASIPVEVVCQSIGFEGKPARAVAIRDLSDRRRDEARIRHLAHYDALTDLPNRSMLYERLASALEDAALSCTLVALLYLDLDHFKPVNDSLGHAGGDKLLQQVAQRLLNELRATDTLARMGGDEFVIVLPVTDGQHAAVTSERIGSALAKPFEINSRMVQIGVSIGVSLFPDDGRDGETLLHNADTAMYRAKANAQGSFCFFEAAVDEQMQQRFLLEQDLRCAIERNQMEVCYQPLVITSTGKVDGFEALLRWQHPKHGLIPPTFFIPLAEKAGLIDRLGHWVLETACAEAACWPDLLQLAVNLSRSQLRQAELSTIVAEILGRTGLPAWRLEVEITEGVSIDGTSCAREVLTSLRALGCSVVLDDFGTGYSSLSYLHSFKFDKIKIDRSFVQSLGRSDEALTIVRAIIGLGRNLALSVTAEGVQTESQLEMLRELGCDRVQGFLLGRPMPRSEISGWTLARAKTSVTRPFSNGVAESRLTSWTVH